MKKEFLLLPTVLQVPASTHAVPGTLVAGGRRAEARPDTHHPVCLQCRGGGENTFLPGDWWVVGQRGHLTMTHVGACRGLAVHSHRI